MNLYVTYIIVECSNCGVETLIHEDEDPEELCYTCYREEEE